MIGADSLQRAWRMVLAAVRNFLADGCLDLSAAVAFYALLSIGPLLYLVSLTLDAVFGIGDGLDLAVDRIEAFLPPEVAQKTQSLPPVLVHSNPLLLVALPALLWAATTVFSCLEGAINVAFATRGRGLWRSRLNAFAVLGVGCVILFLSLLFKAAISVLTELGERLTDLAPPTRLTGFLSHLTLLLASYLAFLIFFRWLPRTRVSWRAASGGALFALLLWEAARQVFAGILFRSPTFGLVTGALAGIIAFLLWIYTAVAIFLLGAELAALINGNRPDRGS
jgi:membrane protein